MNRKRKTPAVRIAAALGALVLIGTLLLAANLFMGNPVSRLMARGDGAAYLKKHHGGMDLKIEKTGYNMTDGNYVLSVRSETSEDTHFSLYWDHGAKIYRSSYEQDVLAGHNTQLRLERTYQERLTSLLEEELGDDLLSLYPIAEKLQTPAHPLDTPFEPETLSVEELDFVFAPQDWRETARCMEAAYACMRKNGYRAESFMLSGKPDKGKAYSVQGIRPEQILGGELGTLLEKAAAQGEYEGIRFHG